MPAPISAVSPPPGTCCGTQSAASDQLPLTPLAHLIVAMFPPIADRACRAGDGGAPAIGVFARAYNCRWLRHVQDSSEEHCDDGATRRNGLPAAKSVGFRGSDPTGYDSVIDRTRKSNGTK
jgi:hypothetical protein